MQWTGNGPYAGFSNSKPWLPVNKNFVDVNVETESSVDTSRLNVYRAMATLRKTFPAFASGELKVVTVDGVLAIGRY